MALSACGAPVGGSARESNAAPAKGTLRAAKCRQERRTPRSNACIWREPIFRTGPGRIEVEGKRGEQKFDVTANERGRRTGTTVEPRGALRPDCRTPPTRFGAGRQ